MHGPALFRLRSHPRSHPWLVPPADFPAEHRRRRRGPSATAGGEREHAVAVILARIGAFCARHRWPVLGAWLVVLVLAVGLAARFAEPLDSQLTVSGLPSTQTLDRVDREFGTGGPQGRVVVAAPAGRTLAAYRPALAALGRALGAEPTLSPAGRIGYFTVAAAPAAAL